MARELIEGVSLGTTVLMLPLVFGLIYVGYLLLPYLRSLYAYLFAPPRAASMQVGGRHLYREESCPICLQRPQLQISGTCGHAFCSHCLFEIYDRNKLKINCPACRRPVTTMLRVFEPHNPPTRDQQVYLNRIKEYNYLYDDNRGVAYCPKADPEVLGGAAGAVGAHPQRALQPDVLHLPAAQLRQVPRHLLPGGLRAESLRHPAREFLRGGRAHRRPHHLLHRPGTHQPGSHGLREAPAMIPLVQISIFVNVLRLNVVDEEGHPADQSLVAQVQPLQHSESHQVYFTAANAYTTPKRQPAKI